MDLEIICAKTKVESKSRGEQVRRLVRSTDRVAGSKFMMELVWQIDSKITACCHFMQPIGNQLVPSLLAAGAKRKIALVRNFRENDFCNSNGLFIPSAFLLLLCFRHRHFTRLA